MGKAEFWNDYRAFCKLDKDGKKEISPITALDPSLHAIYLELVRIGSLRIPINLNKVVRPQAWGLPSSEIKVPMLELVQLFNLYIEEVPVPAPVALPAFKGHKMGYTDIDDVETEEMDLGDEMEHDDFVSESEDEDEEYKPYSDSDSDSGSDFDFDSPSGAGAGSDSGSDPGSDSGSVVASVSPRLRAPSVSGSC